MPEIIYESEYKDAKTGLPGLTIKRNDKNKFIICSLYYFADPAKRDPKWEEEARAGMPDAGWNREMLIDYTAMAGQKIFPELFDHETSIIVPPHDLTPEGYGFVGGFDYGPHNPSAFIVFAKNRHEPDAPWFAVWEQYAPCHNIPEFANTMKTCPYYSYLKYIAADPSIWARQQQIKSGNPTSIHQKFCDEGVFLFTPGVTDEPSWIAEMHKHWMRDEPTFRIFANCPNLIREFKDAIYSEPKSIDPNVPYSDRMADRNNHALDATKYFMNSLPDASVSQRKEFKYPKMVNRWKH